LILVNFHLWIESASLEFVERLRRAGLQMQGQRDISTCKSILSWRTKPKQTEHRQTEHRQTDSGQTANIAPLPLPWK
jgi:hypothetical protein